MSPPHQLKAAWFQSLLPRQSRQSFLFISKALNKHGQEGKANICKVQYLQQVPPQFHHPP